MEKPDLSARGVTDRVFLWSDFPGWPHKAEYVNLGVQAYSDPGILAPTTLNSPFFIWMLLIVHSFPLTW